MNEELLNQALAEPLHTMIETQSFILEQAPDVVQQLILFTIVFRGLLLLLSVLFACAFIHSIKRGWAKDSKGPITGCDRKEPTVFLPYGVSAFILSFGLFAANIEVFLQAWFAPKVFVIEYISKLVS